MPPDTSDKELDQELDKGIKEARSAIEQMSITIRAKPILALLMFPLLCILLPVLKLLEWIRKKE